MLTKQILFKSILLFTFIVLVPAVTLHAQTDDASQRESNKNLDTEQVLKAMGEVFDSATMGTLTSTKSLGPAMSERELKSVVVEATAHFQSTNEADNIRKFEARYPDASLKSTEDAVKFVFDLGARPEAPKGSRMIVPDEGNSNRVVAQQAEEAEKMRLDSMEKTETPNIADHKELVAQATQKVLDAVNNNNPEEAKKAIEAVAKVVTPEEVKQIIVATVKDDTEKQQLIDTYVTVAKDPLPEETVKVDTAPKEEAKKVEEDKKDTTPDPTKTVEEDKEKKISVDPTPVSPHL